MIKRLYVDNYRCLESFEFTPDGAHSVLLIGDNGSGKSTIRSVLEIFQSIGKGINRVDRLVTINDLPRREEKWGRSIHIEMECRLGESEYHYEISLISPTRPDQKPQEMSVSVETLIVDREIVFERFSSDVIRLKSDGTGDRIQIVTNLFALPILQESSIEDPIYIFKEWLSHMVLISPLPQLITGESEKESLQPNRSLSNLSEWFSGLIGNHPSAYSVLFKYLKQVSPDLVDIKNPRLSTFARLIEVQYFNGQSGMKLSLDELSDGEKIQFVIGILLAANEAYGPLFCYWDEPDNFLSTSEVGFAAMALRRAFEQSGQILLASHHPEVIRKFSDETTYHIQRANHLSPTRIRRLDKIDITGDLVEAITSGDLND